MAFTSPGLGHKSKLRIAKESTAGTAAATATAEYEISDFALDDNMNVIVCPNINTVGLSARGIIPGPQFVTGRFGIQMGFDGCEEFLRWVLATYSAATVETTARDHSYKEGQLLPYTFEVSVGDIPVGKVDRYTGVTPTRIRARMDTGGILLAECGFAAYAIAENTTPMGGATAVQNTLPIAFHQALRSSGNLKDGSGLTETSIFLRSLALSIEYPHQTNRPFLGQIMSDAPIRNGNMSAMIEAEYEWDVNNYILQAALLNNAPAAGGLKFLFQHPTVVGATTAKREFEIIASSPIAAGYSKELPGPGAWTQRARWQLAYNATDLSCIKIRARTNGAALA